MNVRILHKSETIIRMTEEQAKALVQWNQEESNNVLLARGWSPPHPETGVREYFFKINWTHVDTLLSSIPVIQELMKHKGEILATGNFIAWTSRGL